MAYRGCLLALACGLLFGCTQPRDIETYSVPKPDPPPDAILAAIVAEGDFAWFFKVAGPAEAVTEQGGQLKALVRSASIAGPDDDPVARWTPRPSWTEQPGSGEQVATITIPSQPPLEMTVTRLPLLTEQFTWEEYVLLNVNRWREQLLLPPLGSMDELVADIFSTNDGAKIVLVLARGELDKSKIKTPRVMPRPPSQPPAGDVAVKYEQPETWEPGPLKAMRKAAFVVTEGDQSAEITVIPLGQGSGTRLQQVNRWRDQVALPPLSDDGLAAHVETIQIGPHEGAYAKAVGPEKTILAAFFDAQGSTWYVKLTGDNELAEQEEERFKEFAQSIRLVE